MPKPERIQPLQLYQLLPRTNCRLCGCNTCFAFAFALISREKKPADCPGLLDQAFADSLHQLNRIFGKAEIIDGTGFAIEREKCNGCGDCIVVCARAITTVTLGSGMLYHRDAVPPVLQVIDGVVQVVNWSSCKRMMSPPDYCRVCVEKCPFGALDLVR